MKKKIYVMVPIFLAVCIVIGGVIYYHIPKEYAVYVNGERCEDISAYMAEGCLYLPVLDMMELLGYDVIRADKENPYFIIDEVKYVVDISQNQIYAGEYQYFNRGTGGRTYIHINDKDVYAMGFDWFFEEIGKTPIDKSIDYWKHRVYIELE